MLYAIMISIVSVGSVVAYRLLENKKLPLPVEKEDVLYIYIPNL